MSAPGIAYDVLNTFYAKACGAMNATKQRDQAVALAKSHPKEASAKIANEDAEQVYEVMKTSCQPEAHWRCERALKNGAKIISGERQPRPFFW